MSGVRLMLARHGQTDANVARALDSRPPGMPLNAFGRAQAAALAQRLAPEPITAVYASTAIRAQQTAAPVGAARGLPVGVLAGVHEVFVGDLEGRSDRQALEAFEEVYSAWWRGDLAATMPGGESAHDLRARFVQAVDDVTGAAGGTILLVSHGAAIRLAAAALLGETAETQYVPNTGLVVLRADGGGWELEYWDGAPPVVGDVTAGGSAADDGAA